MKGTKTYGLLLATVLGVAAMCGAPAWAQPVEAGLLDIAIMPPDVKTVDRVDLEAGVIVLDGDRYSIDPEALEPGKLASPPGPLMDPADLATGMRAYFLTDGTEPSATHRPRILGVWWAQ